MILSSVKYESLLSIEFDCFSIEFNELKFKVIRVVVIPIIKITTNTSISVKPLEKFYSCIQFPMSESSPEPPSKPSAPRVYRSYLADLLDGYSYILSSHGSFGIDEI